MRWLPPGRATRWRPLGVARAWLAVAVAAAAAAVVIVALAGGERAALGSDFGPHYRIERVVVRGNARTATDVIARELLVRVGDDLGADDARVELSRYRVLALGFFSDVRLALERGSARGQAVLVVEVSERGTLIINQLFLGTSEAVPLWGGLDVSETNLGGRGIVLGAAVVAGATGSVPEAHPQQAYRLRLGVPRILGTPFSVSTTVLYNDASEPYRVSGAPGDGAPERFTAVHYRRGGGVVGFTTDIGNSLHLGVDYRLERVSAELPGALVATLPDGRQRRVAPLLRPGDSIDSTVSLRFERDTRSDPVLPLEGSRTTVVGELGTRLLGSSYEFYKLTVSYQGWFRLPWGHVMSALTLAGFIIGDAPLFDRYYVGDVDPLIPPRALGLTFSTQPARNLLGAGITGERYGTLTGRLGVEYLWPLFRGGRFFYGGHLFAGFGGLALATTDDTRARDGDGIWRALPIDLYFDAGLRLDTYVGIFSFSIANFLGRLPY